MPPPELPPIDEMLAVLKRAYEAGKKWESFIPYDPFFFSLEQGQNITTLKKRAEYKIEELAYLRDRSYQRIICNLPSLYWDALNMLQDDQRIERLTTTKEKFDQLQNTELVRENTVINAYFKPSPPTGEQPPCS